jgi:tRNA-2-methylthio-N6-dimethylallyladenosine synthase
VNGDEVGFPDLLEEICKLDGNFWLTFLTSHPKDFSKELVDTMSKCEKICKYLNLPIQSGSNDVLKKMNRNYTWMDYTNKIDYLLEKIPDIRLSTDIIVGFPGETEKDFLDTYSLVKKIDYSMAYVSEYSPRPGAVSEKMVDNVPKAVKKSRKKKITDLVTDYVKYQNESEIGEEKEILVISEKRGQTFDLRDVILKGKGWKQGEFIKGKIIEGNEKGLVAEVAD